MSEGFQFNPKPQQKSLETLKIAFKQKLDVILYKQLTVENIEAFADDALNETIEFTDDVLKEYNDNPNVRPGPIPLEKQTQEDEAFKILELPNIQEILQSIIKVKEEINSIKTHIDTNTENIDNVITPPQENGTRIENGGGKGLEQKRMRPRLLTLLYIIEHDFDIQPADIKITEGITTKDMMRKVPYTRVEIPQLERVVYVCDEEENSSYVFDAKKLIENGVTVDKLDTDDKGDKNSLIVKYPGIGIRLIQSPGWRDNISSVLRDMIPEKQVDKKEEKKERVSEFKERKEFLSFSAFQAEVKSLYPGEGGTEKWYKQEQKNHSNWPTNPSKLYKNKGWIDWSELVGKENFLKKDWQPFSAFQAEVKSLYPGEGGTEKWYKQEQKNHSNWPTNPEKTYKNKGWIDWPELVGKENFLKKGLLSFIDFKKEIISLYPGKGNIYKWYKKERKYHSNWPSSPYKVYKDKGWIGFPELVGKENQTKKEWLPFLDFQAEVKGLYEEQKNIYGWYKQAQKKHSNWPASPDQIYKDKGWIGFSELVGKEKNK